MATEALRREQEELLEARAAIETERRRDRDLFELAPDGYIVTTPDGLIVHANQAAVTMLGVRRERLVDSPITAVVPEEARRAVRARLSQLRVAADDIRWEMRLRPPGGDPIEVAVAVACTRSPDGEPESVRWLLRDVTEQKQIRGQLRQLQKIEAIGRLTGGVIQDFNFLLPAQQARFKSKFITDLLLGHMAGEADTIPLAAEIFGIDLTLPRVALALDAREAVERLAAERLHDRTGRHVIPQTLRLEFARADFLERVTGFQSTAETDVCGFVDDHWLAILAVVEPEVVEANRFHIARRVHHFLDDVAASLGVRMKAGIGRYYPGWPQLARSFVDAQAAAEKGSRLHGPGRIFSIEELGLAGFLVEMDSVSRDELAQRVLQPLDDEPELLATLETFLRSDLSPSSAAERLTIHRHTLTYRLRKITRLTRLDPRKFEDAAHLFAAMLLRRANDIAA